MTTRSGDKLVAPSPSVARSHRYRYGVQPGTVFTVTLGGLCGALARYGLLSLERPQDRTFPWVMFGINVSGCFAIGALMFVTEERLTRGDFWRLLIGVGFLGGYTTFSTYALDAQEMITHAQPRLALLYMLSTLAAGLIAVPSGAIFAKQLYRSARILKGKL